MEDRVTKGHVQPFWTDEYKRFNYVRQDVSDEERDTWESQGYDYIKSFTGQMYDSRNPMPKWIDGMKQCFGLYKQSYTFYRMNTLEIMPTHSDHYRTYMRLNDTEYDDVFRVVVMLEDWKPGHYFELDGVGYVNWEAGDWFKWKGDVPHAASNIGVEPRYTLQITGTTVYSGQMNDLFCFNVPKVKNKEIDHPMFELQVLPALKKYADKPMMVNLDAGNIKRLENLTHSDKDIEELNSKGLTIHLNEPLCSYLKDAKPLGKNLSVHNHNFYSDFKSDIDYQDLRADELDSILDYVERNQLTDVTVCTGDFNVENCYPYYASKMKLATDDLFLKMLHPNKNIDIKLQSTGKFDYKFLCLNWRYTKHRNLAATFVSQRTSKVSWYFDVPLRLLKDNLFFDLEKWKEEHPLFYQTLEFGTRHAREHGPLTLDTFGNRKVVHTNSLYYEIWPDTLDLKEGQTPALYNNIRNSLQEFYEKAFCDVVTESRFAQPTANISEKVFQPVQYLRPFILFAPPYSLEYFRTFGFKTFSDYWDESYDTETCHEKRLIKLFELINSIEQYSIEDLEKMYQDMMPILEHNRSVLFSFHHRHAWKEEKKLWKR